MPISKKKVRFVYKRSQLKWGSTLMRAHMMARAAQAHLGAQYDFGVLNLPTRRIPGLQPAWARLQGGDAIYIFTKHALLALDPETLGVLGRRAAGICADHVDADLAQTLTIPADVHIACSYSSKAGMDRYFAGRPAGGQVMLLHHNVDERIYTLPQCGQEALRAVYFGRDYLTVSSEEIARRVSFLDASDNATMERNYRLLPRYNLHYCVRRAERALGPQQHKPFTKGFTAAVCGANVIVNRSVEDVLEFLGEDYPYLLDGTGEAEIVEGLRKVEATFGGPEWRHARAVMDSVAERVSPRALSGQLHDILRLF